MAASIADGAIRASWRSAAIWRSRSFLHAWLAGWLWSTARWMVVFAAPYLVQQQTHSVFLAQVAGATLFLPTLLGSRVVGRLTDRRDRGMLCLAVLVGITAVYAGLVCVSATHGLPTWGVFVVALVTGMGVVLNLVTRRTLIYSSVPDRYAGVAIALDSLAQYGSAILGPVVAATLLACWRSTGVLAALVACNLGAAALLRLGVANGPEGPAISDLGIDGPALAPALPEHGRHGPIPHLPALLGVTVVMNLCYFPSSYLVPAIADTLRLTTVAAGFLGSAAGVGAIAVGVAIVMRMPHAPGAVFLVGSGCSLAGLVVAGMSSVPAAAFLGFLIAGGGMAAFSAMQSVLVLRIAPVESQGRAMGAVSTAIGVLPVGGVLLGLIARPVGAPAALALVGACGLAALVVWALLHRVLVAL